MKYIVAGTWIEWQDYCIHHGISNARYVTHPSQLPEIIKPGDAFIFIGTFHQRERSKALLKHIKEKVILNG